MNTAQGEMAARNDEAFAIAKIGNPWLAGSRLAAYGLLTAALLPFQAAALACWPALARAIPRAHHRLTAGIIGLRVRCDGAPVQDPSVLFVSNHVSYFDVIALGSLLDAGFVAKSDVAAWPVFGFLARLCRTVFIDRRATDPRSQIGNIRARLDTPDSLIVFPEGTSSDGSRVLPFKSTLFAAVESSAVLIQPISIRYARLNGIPIGRAYRPFYAWFGDMDLAPHLWSALSLGSAEIIIRFHDPVRASDFADRKALANHCYRQVAEGVGRDGEP
jgi:1-acyl-sn-glycerol-3-phosphate acyltransferase